LLRAAPKIILEVENKIPLTKPNVDKATKIDIIHEYCPISFCPKALINGHFNVHHLNFKILSFLLTTATAFEAIISLGLRSEKYATFAKV
jgi:hypothetical protein